MEVTERERTAFSVFNKMIYSTALSKIKVPLSKLNGAGDQISLGFLEGHDTENA